MAFGHRFGSKQKIAHSELAVPPLLEGGKDTKPLRPFLRLVLGAAARLPLSVLHAFGGALGWTIYLLSARYRSHLKHNLRQAGVEDSIVRREAIASAGRMLAELPAMWFRPHEQTA